MEIINRSLAQKMNLSQVRMVGEGGNEILHITEALQRAEEEGLDLVLVSDTSTPPVVRVQDFKKLEYEKKKAKKASKQTSVSLKEIQFKINISEHDLGTKISKIDAFLKRGDKVKISVRLKGRERENPERAFQLLEKIHASVDCKVNMVPGPVAMSILEPNKVPGQKAVLKPKAPSPPAPAKPEDAAAFSTK